jgi:hypothetical protein
MTNIFKTVANWLTGVIPYTMDDVKVNEMTATITPTTDGKFGLVTRTGEFVGVYSRRRDAVRGASRRGFVVA